MAYCKAYKVRQKMKNCHYPRSVTIASWHTVILSLKACPKCNVNKLKLHLEVSWFFYKDKYQLFILQ